MAGQIYFQLKKDEGYTNYFVFNNVASVTHVYLTDSAISREVYNLLPENTCISFGPNAHNIYCPNSNNWYGAKVVWESYIPIPSEYREINRQQLIANAKYSGVPSGDWDEVKLKMKVYKKSNFSSSYQEILEQEFTLSTSYSSIYGVATVFPYSTSQPYYYKVEIYGGYWEA